MVISRSIQTQVNVADKVNLAIRKATTFGHLRTLVHEHRFDTTGSVDYGAHWIYIKFRVEREYLLLWEGRHNLLRHEQS